MTGGATLPMIRWPVVQNFCAPASVDYRRRPCPEWPRRPDRKVERREGRNDMTALRRLTTQARRFGRGCSGSAGVFLRDVGQGLLEVSHNTLALLGLLAVAAVVFVGGRADLRTTIEAQTLDWLQA